LSDYADRTEASLGKQPAEAFFRSLDGLPLGKALDKIAARFDYTWRKSHGWYLFRSRHWKKERQERMAQAEAEEEETETVSRHHQTPPLSPLGAEAYNDHVGCGVTKRGPWHHA